MADAAIAGYARAITEIARAEGAIDRVEDELFTFARTVEANPELRDRLTDIGVGVESKLKIVTELLGPRAHDRTVTAAVLLVQAGRARQLVEIADEVSRLAAQARSHAVAEVRSAVPLDEQQRTRLAQAVSATTGKQVDLKVIVDPKVLGGIVVTVGDTVIDGSVARRLDTLKSRLTQA